MYLTFGAVALLTAIFTYVYTRIVDKNKHDVSIRTFFTVLVGGIVSSAIVNLYTSRPPPVLMEPFETIS